MVRSPRSGREQAGWRAASDGRTGRVVQHVAPAAGRSSWPAAAVSASSPDHPVLARSQWQPQLIERPCGGRACMPARAFLASPCRASALADFTRFREELEPDGLGRKTIKNQR